MYFLSKKVLASKCSGIKETQNVSYVLHSVIQIQIQTPIQIQIRCSNANLSRCRHEFMQSGILLFKEGSITVTSDMAVILFFLHTIYPLLPRATSVRWPCWSWNSTAYNCKSWKFSPRVRNYSWNSLAYNCNFLKFLLPSFVTRFLISLHLYKGAFRQKISNWKHLYHNQSLHNAASNEIKEIEFCKKCPKVKPYPAPIFDPIMFKNLCDFLPNVFLCQNWQV